ncbi:MAG TPA: tRNA (N6-threonylcarbamoyladenosine(37)-N6)-methyltransferase TrmO [Microthrixaceae bacterium]|nr:tRNA (N6-threonylcarbamoyladenosine(37)-N6)-methyltransferase TrmO [Microthrixaceae bacterium]
MTETRFEVVPVGWVESPLTDLGAAPPQGDEGAPDATIVIRREVRDALSGLQVGDEVIVLTWLDRGDRQTLDVHPRGDTTRPKHGVFATRSPDRPNPVGLHAVRLLNIDQGRLRVAGLEALDGTPVIDIKPVLGAIPDR